MGTAPPVPLFPITARPSGLGMFDRTPNNLVRSATRSSHSCLKLPTRLRPYMPVDLLPRHALRHFSFPLPEAW